MRTLLFLALVALLVGASVVPNATSRSTGIDSSLSSSVAANGCTCHNADASSGVALNLTAPANFTAGETYTLTITMQSDVATDGENQGGFYLSVTQGRLASADNSTQVIDRYLTHTTMGNDQRNWNFSWTAPDDDTRIADFMLYGSAVNGNGGLSDFIKKAGDEKTKQKYLGLRNKRLIQFTFVGDEFRPDTEFKMPEIPEELPAAPEKEKVIPVPKTKVVAAPAPPVKKEQKKSLDYNAVDKKWFKKIDESGRVHASIAGQIANSAMGSRTLKHTEFKNLKNLIESSKVLSKKWVQNETHYIQRLNFKPEVKAKKTPPTPARKAPDKEKSIKILRKAIREIVNSPISIVTFNNKLKDYLVANDYPEPRPKSLYRDCGFPFSANTITVLEAHAKDLITWQIPIDPKTGSAAINKTTLQLVRRP